MNFRDFLNSRETSSYINEEFRTDAEGIKQLQAKQDDLYTKLRTYLLSNKRTRE